MEVSTSRCRSRRVRTRCILSGEMWSSVEQRKVEMWVDESRQVGPVSAAVNPLLPSRLATSRTPVTLDRLLYRVRILRKVFSRRDGGARNAVRAELPWMLMARRSGT